MTIHDILAEFRDDALNNRDLGDRFERLMAGYLRTDPQYADMFGTNVWLWTEWPGRKNMPDTGIDLVAEDQYTGDIWAIQCKFFLPTHPLQKADIDSFFTASGKKPFTRRMIVSTTDKWGKNAEDAIQNQTIPTTRLRVQDLDESPIDWSAFSLQRLDKLKLRAKHRLRPHQKEALSDVEQGFRKSDRGKLIMACGTGKTFASLRLAEKLAPEHGSVLFLVPSISLLSQTLREWTAESKRHLHCYAVCSDTKVGKKQISEDMGVVDLAFPAHTDPKKLVQQHEAVAKKTNSLNVVFSTYQSIAVISEAQKRGFPEFDIVVCDEAHRTTGVESSAKSASAFVAVHDNDFVKAKRRLYMTATPRLYDDASKAKAKGSDDIVLYSMDDEEHYGPEFHRLDFSKAVRLDLLTDYKVLVLAVDEKYVSKAFQSQLSTNKELSLDDAVKIAGCYSGLRRRIADGDGESSDIDDTSLHRAVAFCRDIKSSKLIAKMFEELIAQYQTHGMGYHQSDKPNKPT